ncbi:hypothetical protein [Hymenobacter yonginensis]|uniref:Outer membrane protein beta-barrel domain-containing protein n=1 Tax=Hymenobacter yonginensis TaxID=748197 RepID=A0ABY7PPU8_9BACT|nr:hypothetical protein [Hymenobacter yonginensis]WBO84203.1 hypothetical protein O9Z63_17735 [Hymenobacter yonginensis]
MKKLATSLLLLGAATAAHAQTSAGTVLLGGNVGYSSSKEEYSPSSLGSSSSERTQREFRFSPSVGYFVADNLAVGLIADLQTNKTKQPYTEYDQGVPSTYRFESTGSYKSIGPFVRYYKMIGEKAGFYGQLAGGYRTGRSRSESNAPFFEGSDGKYRGSYANLTPGFVFFPTPKIGLELTSGSIGYYNNKNTQEPTRQRIGQDNKSSGFGAYFGLQNLNIGASIYLGSN